MKKILTLSIVLTLFVGCLSLRSAALTVNSTYADVSSTSTQAVNLVNYAMSYSDFIESDYLIFCNEQNSYYIVWGSLNYDGSTITGTYVEYIRYYRTGTGTSNQYVYDYGTDTSFKLQPSHICTSNIENFGFSSTAYQQYKHYHYFEYFIIFSGSMLFVIFISQLRRGSKHV